MSYNPVLVKRSNVPGKVPTTAQLQAGELAINTADAKLYFSTGVRIVEVGSSELPNVATTFTYIDNIFVVVSSVAFQPNTTKLYINGMRMAPGVDYTELSDTELVIHNYELADINNVVLDIFVK
jgi:hypothetical protein